jgi:hypothetical protein
MPVKITGLRHMASFGLMCAILACHIMGTSEANTASDSVSKFFSNTYADSCLKDRRCSVECVLASVLRREGESCIHRFRHPLKHDAARHSPSLSKQRV